MILHKIQLLLAIMHNGFHEAAVFKKSGLFIELDVF